MTENWRPYSFEENGVVRGTSTDIVKKVLKRAGVDYTLSVYPWSKGYKLAKSERNVMIFSLVRIPVREEMFQWVRPLGSGDTSSLYRLKNDTATTPKSLEEAKKLTVLTVVDSMDHLWLSGNGFEDIVTASTLKQSVEMFIAGKAAIIALDDKSVVSLLSEFSEHRGKLVKVLPLFEAPPYIALSNGTSAKLLQKLQKAYDDLLLEGKIRLVN